MQESDFLHVALQDFAWSHLSLHEPTCLYFNIAQGRPTSLYLHGKMGMRITYRQCHTWFDSTLCRWDCLINTLHSISRVSLAHGSGESGVSGESQKIRKYLKLLVQKKVSISTSWVLFLSLQVMGWLNKYLVVHLINWWKQKQYDLELS